MTLGSYLAALEKKNPAIFKAEKICISVDSFKDQIARAYSAGLDQGMAAHEDARPHAANEVFDLFNGFRKP